MKNINQLCIRVAVGLVLCVPLLPSLAQYSAPHAYATRADQVRWSQENTSSSRDYLHTLKQEALAALWTNEHECKKIAARKDRANCMAEARATYKQDMIDARQHARDMSH